MIDIAEIVQVLSLASTARFAVTVSESGVIRSDFCLSLPASSSRLSDCLNKYLETVDVIDEPEILVVRSFATDLDDQLLLNNSRYSFNSALCDSCNVYLRSGDGFLCHSGSSWQAVPSISEAVSLAFYEKLPGISLKSLAQFATGSPLEANVKRALQSTAIDWSLFEWAPGFLEFAANAIAKFSIRPLLSHLASNGEFAIDFFDDSLDLLLDLEFVHSFEDEIVQLMNSHPDAPGLVDVLVDLLPKSPDPVLDLLARLSQTVDVPSETVQRVLAMPEAQKSTRSPPFFQVWLARSGADPISLARSSPEGFSALVKSSDFTQIVGLFPLTAAEQNILVSDARPAVVLAILASEKADASFLLCVLLSQAFPKTFGLIPALAKFASDAELNANPSWLQSIAQSPDESLQKSVCKLIEAIWSPSGTPQPMVCFFLRDFAFRFDPLFALSTVAKYRDWFPFGSDIAAPFLYSLLSRDPLGNPDFDGLLDLVLDLPPVDPGLFEQIWLSNCSAEMMATRRRPEALFLLGSALALLLAKIPAVSEVMPSIGCPQNIIRGVILSHSNFPRALFAQFADRLLRLLQKGLSKGDPTVFEVLENYPVIGANNCASLLETSEITEPPLLEYLIVFVARILGADDAALSNFFSAEERLSAKEKWLELANTAMDIFLASGSGPIASLEYFVNCEEVLGFGGRTKRNAAKLEFLKFLEHLCTLSPPVVAVIVAYWASRPVEFLNSGDHSVRLACSNAICRIFPLLQDRDFCFAWTGVIVREFVEGCAGGPELDVILPFIEVIMSIFQSGVNLSRVLAALVGSPQVFLVPIIFQMSAAEANILQTFYEALFRAVRAGPNGYEFNLAWIGLFVTTMPEGDKVSLRLLSLFFAELGRVVKIPEAEFMRIAAMLAKDRIEDRGLLNAFSTLRPGKGR
jgi:hypothetical protein